MVHFWPKIARGSAIPYFWSFLTKIWLKMVKNGDFRHKSRRRRDLCRKSPFLTIFNQFLKKVTNATFLTKKVPKKGHFWPFLAQKLRPMFPVLIAPVC